MKKEGELSNADENEIPLAFEEMYAQLSKKGSGYKEGLHAVIIGCVSLELSINLLVKTAARKLPSSGLGKWARNVNASIHSKLKALRSARLISEDIFKNLDILFKIRNRFAHDVPIPPKTLRAEFESLRDVSIGSNFVRNLPNDSVKFQLIVSQCFVDLLKIRRRNRGGYYSVRGLILASPVHPIYVLKWK